MAQREERSLPVRLTARETENYQVQLSRGVVELDELEAKKKAYNDEVGSDIKEAKARNSRLAKTIERGEEHRQVACEGRNMGGVWIVTRLDTGEVVEERAPRTAAEQQTELFEDGEEWPWRSAFSCPVFRSQEGPKKDSGPRKPSG